MPAGGRLKVDACMSFLPHFFEGSAWKRYPILVAVLAVIALFLVTVSPGLTPGIDLTGGQVLVFKTEKALDADPVQSVLEKEFGLEDVAVQSVSSPLGNSIRVQFSQPRFWRDSQDLLTVAENNVTSNPAVALDNVNQIQALLQPIRPFTIPQGSTPLESVVAAKEAIALAKENFNNRVQERLSSLLQLPSDVAFSRSEVAPVLGQTFWQGALTVAILSAIFLVIAVFILFREFVPSLAIILAMVFDVLIALSGMAVFGIPLSLATIPTLLMIVGYSIDTDILLTTRLLQRKEGTVHSRAHESMITGLTMTATGLISILVLLVLSYFTQIDVMFTIASILLFGLIGDIISTWFMNAPLLLWYLDRKEKHAAR